MAAVVVEQEARKKPRLVFPETGEQEEARPRNGNGASAGMPLFLNSPSAGVTKRTNGHGAENPEQEPRPVTPAVTAEKAQTAEQTTPPTPAGVQPGSPLSQPISAPESATQPAHQAERPTEPAAPPQATKPLPPTSPAPSLPGATPVQVPAPEAAEPQPVSSSAIESGAPRPVVPMAETPPPVTPSVATEAKPTVTSVSRANAFDPAQAMPVKAEGGAKGAMDATGAAPGKGLAEKTTKAAATEGKNATAEGAEAAGEGKPAIAAKAKEATEKGGSKAGEKGAASEAATGAAASQTAARPEEIAKAAMPPGGEGSAAATAGASATGLAADGGGAATPAEAAASEDGGGDGVAGAAETEQRMAQAAGETEEPAQPEDETGGAATSEEPPASEEATNAEQAGAALAPGSPDTNKVSAVEPPSAATTAGSTAEVNGAAPGGSAPEAAGGEGGAASEPAPAEDAGESGNGVESGSPDASVGGPSAEAGAIPSGSEAPAGGDAALANDSATGEEAAVEENAAAGEVENEATAPGEPSAPELAAAGAPDVANAAGAAAPAAESIATAPEAAEATGEAVSPDTTAGAETAELSPAEQGAATASLTESGGGAAEPGGGGGGGGGAIPNQSAPEVPDVSGAEPSQALAAVGNLPPAPLAAALGGVNAAVSRNVGQQRADLAAIPPQMERPSGSPVTKQGSRTAADNGAGESTLRPERAPSGQSVPTPQPAPLPPAPPSPAEAITIPQVSGNDKGEMSEAEAARMASSISSVPTSDPALDATAGPPPVLALAGDADPAQTQQQQAKIERSVAAASAKGRRDAAQPMGEGDIYPTVLPETLKATVPVGSEGSRAGAAVEATVSADDATSIVAQEKSGPEIQSAVGKAQSDMAAERSKHDAQAAEERASTQQEIARTQAENATEQENTRRTAQSEVHGARQNWTQAQQQAADAGRTDANQEMIQGETAVASERAKGEQAAADHISQGNQEAAAAKREGQSKAASERQRGEQESSGFFGWLASKAKAFFDGIKKAIKAALDFARKAVKAAIEAAKKLAVAAIEAARKAVVAVIKRVGDALIAIGDRVLGAFPGLRDRWRNFIKQKVAAAEEAVNRLADKLKEGIKKALDMLGKALDAALGLLEKGLLAAVDFVGGVVQGAIKAAKAIVDAIGTFAVLIKDIASAPGRWISNLAAAVVDGIKNHLWKAFKTAIKNWFNEKLEEVVGLGMTVWNVLTKGGIKLAEIGGMVWEALKSAIPIALVQILVEKLVSMIVPAAGAILAIIEGIPAAWGTISRILQAISRFIAFLKAVKSGNAGPQFADALAAAAIAVIDFVANWLLKRLRKGASKVAGKIKAIAQRILGKIKKVAKKIGQKLKKVGQKIAAKFKKLGNKIKQKWEKFKAKRNKGKPKKDKPKKNKQDKIRERWERGIKALKQMVGKRGGGEMPSFLHRAQLAYLKLRYRFSKLDLSVQGDKWVIDAAMNPNEKVDDSLTITDPNKVNPGTPPGAQPPVSKGFRISGRGNNRLFATDQTGTEWVWVKKTPTSAVQGHWQKTNDDSKIKEAEQEAQKWLESHKANLVSLVKADKAASEHGADVGGLGQEKGQSGKERLFIGEAKLGSGAGSTYFGFKPGDPEANKFTAITTNLESTLAGMRGEALEKGTAEGKGEEYVERVDAALRSGQVTINIFLKGQARIGESGRGGGRSTFMRVRMYVFRELRRILSAAPYNLSRGQLNKIIKNVKVEPPIRI